MSSGISESPLSPRSLTTSPDSAISNPTPSHSSITTFSSRLILSAPSSSSSSSKPTSPQLETKNMGRGDKSKKLRRKKIARACAHCQKSHVTCDEGRPCQRCMKRGLANTCRDAERKPAKYLRQDMTKMNSEDETRNDYTLHIFNDKPLSNVNVPILLNDNTPQEQAAQVQVQQQQQQQQQQKQQSRVILTGPGGYNNSRTNLTTQNLDKGPNNGEGFAGMLNDITNQHFQNQLHQPIMNNNSINANISIDSPSIFPEVYMSNHDFGSKTANLEYSILSNMLKDTYGSPLDSNSSPISNNANSSSPLAVSNVYASSLPSSLNPSELTKPLQRTDDTITNFTMPSFQLVGPRSMRSENTSFNYDNNTNNNNSSTNLLGMNDNIINDNNNNNHDHNNNKYNYMGTPSRNNLNVLDNNRQGSSSNSVIETLPALNISAGDDDDITQAKDASFSEEVKNDKELLPQPPLLEKNSNPPTNEGTNEKSLSFKNYKNPREVYVNVTEPFPYTQGYHLLIAYLRSRFNRSQLIRVARSMAAYRPSFTATTKTLMEEDLIFMEKCFQRTLLEFEKIIPISGTPTIIWRRTGQIAAVGKEFCQLTGWDKGELLNKNRFIVELMDDNSVLQYFDVFSTLAFGDSRGVTMTDCTLLKPNGEKVPTACTWTVKRDVFDIPMMVIGNFLPIF